MPIVFVKNQSKKSIKPSPFRDEGELEQAIAENPSLITGDGEAPLAVVRGQVGLPNAGRLDILMVDATGYPVAVEVKLGRNIESRREVVAQVFDYTSDLSQMTSDELDDLVEGALERALASFDPDENKTQFETRWKACGANLRAGRVRLVIAVDEAKEDLIRIVQYINDHSDLDVRLIAIEKFTESDGGVIFVPSMLVHGGLKEISTSPRRATPSVMNPDFAEVISAYEAVAPRELQPEASTSKNYRKLGFDRWMSSIHYEFMDLKDSVGVEIHLENARLKPVASTLEAMKPAIASAFPDCTVEFDPSWMKGGRLRVFMPKTRGPEAIAKTMLKLIDLSYAQLDEALKQVPDTKKSRPD